MKKSSISALFIPISFVIFFAGGVYSLVGSPTHLTPMSAQNDVRNLYTISDDIADLQSRYSIIFTDGNIHVEDWKSLGIELSSKNSTDAPFAFVTAANFTESDTERAFLLGAAAEHIVRLEGGRVTNQATILFKDILEIDKNDLGALFYLGLEASQRSDLVAIQSFWSRFELIAPANHPLRAKVRNQLNGSSIQELDEAVKQVRVDAILSLSNEERHAHIEAMVAKFRERLQADGGTGEDWRRLARAYVRLGRRSEAIWAYDHAIAVDPENKLITLESKQFSATAR